MKNYMTIKRSILFVIVGLTIAMMWGMDAIRIVDWKIPNEIREGANIALVEALASGNNPYINLETPLGTPNVYYMYPILNNLIAAFFVKILGAPAGLILLLLNYLYTILVAVMIAIIVKYYVKDNFLILVAAILSHYCGWRYTNVSAFPDMLAVLLLTVVMYICTIRKENIRYKDILLLCIITVLAFYTKQYAIVVAFPITIFLGLNAGKKKCTYYIAVTAIIGLLSASIIYVCMPLYFVETLLLVGSSADNDVKWAFTQFVKIGKLFFPWFIFILMWIICEWRKRREFDYVIVNFGFIAMLLLYLGQNTGAHLSYHLQLWLPSVIVLSIRALGWIKGLFLKRFPVNSKWETLIGLTIIVFAIFPYYHLHTPQLSEQQKDNWDRLYELTDDSNNALFTSQNANYAILNEIYVYDCGQNQYILRNEAMGLWESIESSEVILRLFPEAIYIKKLHEDYRKEILDKLIKQEYDGLFLVKQDLGFVRDWEEFQKTKIQYYELTEEIPIETGVWKWDVCVWKAKK